MTGTHLDDETMELEFSEEDVAYYIEDEEGTEIGIALYDEDGNEVEYYYADVDAAEYEAVEDIPVESGAVGDDSSESELGEAFELEFSEEDIAYYIVDEDGNELGFALTEPDGTETEYYYDGVDANAYTAAPAEDDEAASGTVTAVAAASAVAATAAAPSPAQGGTAQPFARRAGEEVGKLATKAGAGAAQAAAAAKDTARKIKDGVTGKPKEEEDEDLGFGLTSGQVKKAAGDFSTLAKEGAQAASELRGVYDDIFGELDFLKPSASSRTTRRR